MNRAINKKLIAIIAIVALVAILGVCLVACNADDYVKRLEKKGYKVEAVTAEDLGIEDAEIEWAVTGIKGSISLNGIEGDMVTVIKFKKSDDAKKYEESAKENTILKLTIKRSGNIVIAGTEQGVKDAQ